MMRASILAPVSLVAAALLFAITLPFSGLWWIDLVHAFAEAAMIGGMADWFAVVALFRHPMGLPIPHTAIISRHREKLTRGAADLVQNMWLNKQVLQDRIRGWDIARTLSEFLASVENGEAIRRVMRDALTLVLRDLDIHSIATAASEILKREIWGGAMRNWLRDTTEHALREDWHRKALALVHERAERVLTSERVQAEIARKLESVANTYASTSLRRVGRWIAESINVVNYEDLAKALTSALLEELQRLANDPQHEFTKRAERWLRALPQRLEEEEAVKDVLLRWIDELLPATRIEQTFSQLRDSIIRDLDGTNSTVLGFIMSWVERGSTRLRDDAGTRHHVNTWLHERIISLVEQHHGTIGELVRHNLERLDDKELTRQIESKVGADLQYIRLNGAVVGGLVGAVLFILKSLLQ
jgi:uncharacterized membrane-anchored protein YjiN (DUF445 family)